jgi:urease accessory protein
MATLYLQSSSGGLYGDDLLRLDVIAGAGTAAHLTTQASTVVHHARGGSSSLVVTLELKTGALLEYMPDPTILFAGAALASRIEVQMAQDAVLMLSDCALVHDPDGAGLPFDRFCADIAISGPDGLPLLIERLDVAGRDWIRRTRALPAHGLFLVAGVDQATALADQIAAVLNGVDTDEVYAASAALPEREIVLVRFLCANGALLTRTQHTIWHAARTALTGLPPQPRRK